eukprot:m.103368 g.103368  ORF g.103368 m.103368 type:complete len:922 (-) comp13808_c0_seq2:1697-4462(-)
MGWEKVFQTRPLLLALPFWAGFIAGLAILLNVIVRNTHSSVIFEGVSNVAFFYSISYLLIGFLPLMFCAMLAQKHERILKFFGAFKYTALVFSIVLTCGIYEPPAGELQWCSISVPNLNMLRLAWGKEEKPSAFLRSPPLIALGLRNWHIPGGPDTKENSFQFGPLSSSVDIDIAVSVTNSTMTTESTTTNINDVNVSGELSGSGDEGGVDEWNASQNFTGGFVETASTTFSSSEAKNSVTGSIAYENTDSTELQQTIAALILIQIMLWLLAAAVVGDRGIGIPFVFNKSLVPVSRNTLVLAGVSLSLGAIASLLLWTSDTARDPTHPFYETVMGIAAYTLILGLLTFLASMTQSSWLTEIVLVACGFFGLATPLRSWQMETLSNVDGLSEYFDYDGELGKYVEAELSRIHTGAGFATISALVAIVCGLKVLTKSMEDKLVYDFLSEESMQPRKFVLVMGMLVMVGCACQWVAVGNAMEAIYTRNTSENVRMSAGIFYIFLFLVLWFCWAAAAFSVKWLKPLWWVGCGLGTAIMTGFVSVGNHDRQLWFINNGFAGIVELHAYLHTGEFEAVRAYGVSEKEYNLAYSGAILMIVGTLSTLAGSIRFPVGSSPRWSRGTWQFTSTSLAVACGIAGTVLLLTLDFAQAPIRHAASISKSPATSHSACSGKYFNVFVDEQSSFCFEERQRSEQFTLNLMTYPSHVFQIIFSFSGISLAMAAVLLIGYIFSDMKAVKLAAIGTPLLWLSLAYPIVWWDLEHGDSCDSIKENGDCQRYKLGLILIFLQSLFTALACGKFIAEMDPLDDETVQRRNSYMHSMRQGSRGSILYQKFDESEKDSNKRYTTNFSPTENYHSNPNEGVLEIPDHIQMGTRASAFSLTPTPVPVSGNFRAPSSQYTGTPDTDGFTPTPTPAPSYRAAYSTAV